MRILFEVLNIRKQITWLSISPLYHQFKCLQQIDVFVSFISESSLAFPSLELLHFGHGNEDSVGMSLKERLKEIREHGGLPRLRSLYFGNINLLA